MGPPAKKLVSLALAVLSPDETRRGPGRCLCSAKFHHWTGPIAGMEPLCHSRSRLLSGSVSQLYRRGFLPGQGLLLIASRLPCLCSASCPSYSSCIFFFSTAVSIYYIVSMKTRIFVRFLYHHVPRFGKLSGMQQQVLNKCLWSQWMSRFNMEMRKSQQYKDGTINVFKTADTVCSLCSLTRKGHVQPCVFPLRQEYNPKSTNHCRPNVGN